MPNSLKSLLPLDALIDAAERHAANYDGDDRQDIKTDVLNAFYAGSKYAEALSRAPIAEGGGDVVPVFREVLALLKNTKELQGREHVSLGIRFNAAIESLSRQGGEAVVWHNGDEPPEGKPHLWTRAVVAVMMSGECYSLMYMHGDDGGGHWQRPYRMDSSDKVLHWCERPGTERVPTRASEAGDCLELLKRIRDDKSWRTNDNALWSDILKAIAAAPALGGGRG